MELETHGSQLREQSRHPCTRVLRSWLGVPGSTGAAEIQLVPPLGAEVSAATVGGSQKKGTVVLFGPSQRPLQTER